MKYKELALAYTDKSFGSINVKREWTELESCGIGWNGVEYVNQCSHGMEEHDGIDEGWKFYLDHSCDEWVIGGLEDAEDFSADLAEAIEYVKNNP